jgi:hypothetical protein
MQISTCTNAPHGLRENFARVKRPEIVATIAGWMIVRLVLDFQVLHAQYPSTYNIYRQSGTQVQTMDVTAERKIDFILEEGTWSSKKRYR